MIEIIAFVFVCFVIATLIWLLGKVLIVELNLWDFISNRKITLSEFLDESGIICNLMDCAELIGYCKERKSYYEWRKLFKELKLI